MPWMNVLDQNRWKMLAGGSGGRRGGEGGQESQDTDRSGQAVHVRVLVLECIYHGLHILQVWQLT